MSQLSEAFSERLAKAVREKRTPLIVGLDPRLEQLPAELVERWRQLRGDGFGAAAAACEEFCRRVIDVIAPLVPAVKVQSAFFEQLGPAGMLAMHHVMSHAQRQSLLVIFDGKRNDIGLTAEAYAAAYLGSRPAGSPPSWPCDAMTVNPYLGLDSLEPFIRGATAAGGGVFVLVKTSNLGSADFQDLVCEGRPLYRHVAEHGERLAAASVSRGPSNEGLERAADTPPCPPLQRGGESYGSIGAVVGATYPAQLAELRAAMPHAWLLVPGYGAQGATAADVAAAFDANGLGAIVNSSRAILFAYEREPYASRFGAARWEEAVEQATQDAVAELAAATPAGRLRDDP